MSKHNRFNSNQRVHHDFSTIEHGTILDTRDHTDGYDCLVKWDNGKQDWYKCTYLIADECPDVELTDLGRKVLEDYATEAT